MAEPMTPGDPGSLALLNRERATLMADGLLADPDRCELAEGGMTWVGPQETFLEGNLWRLLQQAQLELDTARRNAATYQSDYERASSRARKAEALLRHLLGWGDLNEVQRAAIAHVLGDDDPRHAARPGT